MRLWTAVVSIRASLGVQVLYLEEARPGAPGLGRDSRAFFLGHGNGGLLTMYLRKDLRAEVIAA
jgi:hypothetical protein